MKFPDYTSVSLEHIGQIKKHDRYQSDRIKELEKQNENLKALLVRSDYLLHEFSHHFLDGLSVYDSQVNILREEILKEVSDE